LLDRVGTRSRGINVEAHAKRPASRSACEPSDTSAGQIGKPSAAHGIGSH
jgi:hypothetical protein